MRNLFLALLLLATTLAIGVACGSDDSAPSASESGDSTPATVAPGASPEIQELVSRIDALLAVPQDKYPNGETVSYTFEELLNEVSLQKRTLRTHQTAQDMGYFIATGYSLGWYPKENDVANLAREWKKIRADVLAGP